jgi:hypothetical protein
MHEAREESRFRTRLPGGRTDHRARQGAQDSPEHSTLLPVSATPHEVLESPTLGEGNDPTGHHLNGVTCQPDEGPGHLPLGLAVNSRNHNPHPSSDVKHCHLSASEVFERLGRFQELSVRANSD